jgi:hypothetical protein
MPFESRFNTVADLVQSTVVAICEQLKNFGFEPLPQIQRLDWVTSSGVIQSQIWNEIYEADLIFCDVTGYNANVMFEAGVCGAWKHIQQVVFIRDHFYKGQSPFDLAPIRYTEYELTSEGVNKFRQKIEQHVRNAMIAFPDMKSDVAPIHLPLHIKFEHGQDDLRIFTPPFAHRRVISYALEFGSIAFFSHSWASIGKRAFLNFSMHFRARFSNILSEGAFIGVGLRSQHFFANFAHILYLKRDGSIILTEPNEVSPAFYVDTQLRGITPIDLASFHEFRIRFDENELSVEVDGHKTTKQVAQMPKVFGPGLIRLQSYGSWMAVGEIQISE